MIFFMQSHTKKLRILRRIIGENIHFCRYVEKVTLRKLARRTGIDAHKLDQFEMGKNQIQLEHLCVIAQQLNTEIETLLLLPYGDEF